MTSVTIEPGRVLAGRYSLLHLLGEGGMGSVWRASHVELRSTVAIKLIVPRHAQDPAILARFAREARAAAALRSTHVVQIFDYGIDDGCAFIVMEELRGEDLSQRLEREHKLSPRQTATIVTHVARAIALAHDAELVHRDIKPSNIFLVQNDDEIVAKVLDFGIAKMTSPPESAEGSRTHTGAILGSPFYMSPEQARGRSDVDARSDLWSLGVVAYECLVGRRPFDAASLGELVLSICHDPIPVPSSFASVPPAFDAWFAKALERDPERRFQSAKELAAELRAALLVRDTSLSSDGPPGPTPVAVAASLPAASGEATRPPRSGLPESVSKNVGATTTGGTSGARDTARERTTGRRWRGWLAVSAVGAAALAALALLRSPSPPDPAKDVTAASPRSEPRAESVIEPAASLVPPPVITPEVAASASASPPSPSPSLAPAPTMRPKASRTPVAKTPAPPPKSLPGPSAPVPNLLNKRF